MAMRMGARGWRLRARSGLTGGHACASIGGMRAALLTLALVLPACGGNVVVDSYDLNAAEQAPAPECDPEDGTDPACDDSDDCTADRCSPDGACAHSPIGGCAEG